MSQENTYVGISAALLIADSNKSVFQWTLRKFLRTPVLKNTHERLLLYRNVSFANHQLNRESLIKLRIQRMEIFELEKPASQ